MDTPYIVVFTTINDELKARRLASLIIETGLVACVSISAPIFSTYRWQGNIETEKEWLLIIKTIRKNYHRLEKLIRTHHPYQTPEIVALPITAGHAAYLRWLKENCRLIPDKVR